MAGLRGRELGAVDLPFKLGDHEADVGVYLVPAMSRRWRQAASWYLT